MVGAAPGRSGCALGPWTLLAARVVTGLGVGGVFGLAVALVAGLLLVFSFVSINMVERNLAQVKIATDKASTDLMINAYNAMQSDTIKHMVRIQEILDLLAKDDGTLVRYEVKGGGQVEWEALVPLAFAPKYGAVQQGIEKDGRVRVKETR